MIMRKTQSYQEPSANDIKTSSVSNSHEFQKQMRLSSDIDANNYKVQTHHQPLFEIKGISNVQRTQFRKNKLSGNVERVGEENKMVRSLNTNQIPMQNKNYKPQLTTRFSSNVGEDINSYRPSFNPIQKVDYQNRLSQNTEGFLFAKHLNKKQIDKTKEKLQYKITFGYRSNKGKSVKPDKVNQDSYIINLNLDKNQGVNFFGVCDGHGPVGHHVSGFLKNFVTQSNRIFNSKTNIKDQIISTLKTATNKLQNQSKIDLSYSGSTFVGCYICPNKIYCANVGDSRTIIGSKQNNNKTWSVWQVSTDHKPCLKSQSDRIIKSDGRINAIKDREGNYVGPLRVWLKSQDKPGLAMTRSFGDLVAAKVGVHSQPEITQHFLTESDKIVLIASDGVWQFLQNQDIINKLSPYYQKNQLQQACNFLQQYAKTQWINQNHGQIDDITFILIFLHHNS